jgi:hypothetical protein
MQLPFLADNASSSSAQGKIYDEDDDDHSLDELLSLCKGSHPGEYIPDSEDAYSNVDFEDFLTFASNLPEVSEIDPDIRNRSISRITDVGDDNESATVSIDAVESTFERTRARTLSAVEPTSERTRARTLSAITQPVTVQDIPFIIAQLPSAMQGRFLDKFAEAAGVNFTEMLNVTRKRALSNEKMTREENSRQRTLSQQQILYERIDDLAERELSLV